MENPDPESVGSTAGNEADAALATLATLAEAHSPKSWDAPSVRELSADEATAVRRDQSNASEPGADDFAALRSQIELVHDVAKRAGVEGILVLTFIDPKTGKPLIRHFAIGDVEGMIAEAATRSQFSNVYLPLAILRKDLPFGKRGTAEDIVAVLGVAIDDDGDVEGKRAGRPLGVEETICIQTSSEPTRNFQPMWLFTDPVSPAEGAELSGLMYRKCGGDHGTKDNAHVWRVADTLNHLNEAKRARGRPAEPQTVELVGGSFELVDPADLRRSLEAMPDRHTPKATTARRIRSMVDQRIATRSSVVCRTG